MLRFTQTIHMSKETDDTRSRGEYNNRGIIITIILSFIGQTSNKLEYLVIMQA